MDSEYCDNNTCGLQQRKRKQQSVENQSTSVASVICSKRSRDLDDPDIKQDVFLLFVPEIIGIISTYLQLGSPDLTNLVVAMGGRGGRRAFVTAIQRAHLCDNDKYLVQICSIIADTHVLFCEEDKTKYRAARERLRLWMAMNGKWEDRVVQPFAKTGYRKVTVSGRVASTMRLDDNGPYECRHHLVDAANYCPPLLGECGNLLLVVDGASVETAELDKIRDHLLDNDIDEPVELIFMKPEDVLFNNPRIVTKMGLVEILKVMVHKGVIDASTVFEEWNYPLLWSTYFSSIDSSCFTYMLSVEGVDCDRLWSGNTLLRHASCSTRFPLGLDAFMALAHHPTTNVNAVDERHGNSALHNVLELCQYRDKNGAVLVSQVKALLAAGANPLVQHPQLGNAMEHLSTVRNRSSAVANSRWKIKLFDEHLDEIETMLRRALPRWT